MLKGDAIAENFCKLYKQCENFDGRLLIERTVAGPALAVEEGELPFGSLSMRGGSLHPYARLSYGQSGHRSKHATAQYAPSWVWRQEKPLSPRCATASR